MKYEEAKQIMIHGALETDEYYNNGIAIHQVMSMNNYSKRTRKVDNNDF
jgi:hypothetical protein